MSSDRAILVDKLIAQEKYKALVSMYKKAKDDTYQEYDALCYHNGQVRLGDKVLMRENHSNPETFAAVIKKIICIKDPEDTFVPLVKVQWYGAREDVAVPPQFMSCLSRQELFLSTLESYCTVDLLHRNIRVLTHTEYEHLEWEEEFVFFSRAGYNHLTYEVTPPFAKWPKSCICGLPQNPDHQYISCDRCQQWFHLRCVGIRQRTNEFLCPRCK